MRKFSLFMLMAVGLLISGNAWGVATITVNSSDAQALQNAFDSANAGDTIRLESDITDYSWFQTNTNHLLNITKSITLDGNGHKIVGYGSRSNNAKTSLGINHMGSSWISVTIKNLTIVNDGKDGRAIETRGNITSFTMDNCDFQFTGSGNTQGLTIGGSQSSVATLNITNSYLSGTYPLISFNPFNLTTENSKYEGFCSMYFKGVDSSAGSRGTTITATNCDFESPNPYNSATNGFGAFVLEDDGINITLIDCSMNTAELGNQDQELFVFSEAAEPNRREEPCVMTIKNNNSHLNGRLYYNAWNLYFSIYDDDAEYYADEYGIEIQLIDQFEDGGTIVYVYQCPNTQPTITITGGTYSENPSHAFVNTATDEEAYVNFVPSTHEVSEVTQYVEGKAPVTLYRVHKKPEEKAPGVAYTLNDDVETKGGGQNPTTSFILSANETVEAEKTYAEYVEVQSGTITVPEDKTLIIGEGGLVIQEGGALEIQPGGTVTVSKGGAITAKEQSIVIQSNVDATGNYLVDPAVTFNQQPLAKVELYTTAKKNKWQRFAFPLVEGTYGGNVTNDHEDLSLTVVGNNGNFGTAINKWDYDNDKWVAISTTTKMDPFIGYALSNNSNEGGVTYTFHGNIMGNVVDSLGFATNSYTLFGNSYTAPIDIKQLIATVKEGAGADIAGSLYLWSVANQGYVAENFSTIETGMSDYKEIPALQTFIMLNNGAETSAALDYEATIWEPMMDKLYPSGAPAPARSTQEGNLMRLRISSENGLADDIVLMEQSQFSADFEDGADADKYFNENNVNIYTTMDDKKLSILASDNIEGTNISIQTVDDIEYTITFTKVVGGDYALLDNATGIITPIVTDGTYSFVAQANTNLEGRFQIVAAHRAPTDNAEVIARPVNKGVYTIMGQNLGEKTQWEALPAGVYVINGQKIVK